MRIPHCVALLPALLSTACLTATPFDDDLDVRGDVNARAIERIQGAPPTPDFKFVAIGDTHDAYDETEAAVRAINRRDDIRFVLHAGDLTDLSLNVEFERIHRILSDLDVPYVAVIGNHDAIATGPELYDTLYGERDFSFRFGKLKFIVFNSNALEFPGEAPNEEWLRAEHADIQPGERAIWLTHQDVTAPDGENEEQAKAFYGELLRDNPVPLVVHGHLEEYELQRYQTSTVLQCGTFQKVFTYTVVSVFNYGERIEFEKCVEDDCVPVTPEETVL
ncbi:MAG: metallophosphoesterase [Polyangiaceae bacterium]|nr:metallophosphoesterase [Polyangiaceae bacterium]